MSAPALSIDSVSLTYRLQGFASRAKSPMPALDRVSMEIAPGACVGVVGESGSGKSSLAAVALGLEAPDAGTVSLFGVPLAPRIERRSQEQLRTLQIVFQDPNASLDPSWPVWRSVTEGRVLHRLDPPGALRDRAMALLDEVGLTPEHLDRRPHQLSGGQKQRVALARALALEPKVLFLDEPTSALDVAVQARILNLLMDLQARRGLALCLISHDLDVVRHICEHVVVMHRGRVVETGSVEQIFSAPQHDYTRDLIAAIPPPPGRRRPQ